MSGHQTATIADTVYFWFGANDTSGSGGDGASAYFDVREAGAAADAVPLISNGSPTLLTNAAYPAGCYEIAVAATTGNGFAANDTFGVFCTLLVDSQNPTGFVGSCTLTPLAKEAKQDSDNVILDTIAVDVAGLDGEAMRGTNSANTVEPDPVGTAATPAEVATALTDIKLDHLIHAAAAEDEVADNSVIARLAATEGNWSEFDDTTDSLEAIRVRGDDEWTTGAEGSAPTVGEIRTEMEVNGGKLDHLWEMTEDDSGIRRYTENALEEAPSGEGGDATEAKQDSIIAAVITNAAGTDIAADIIAVKAETATIVDDTNELQGAQGDWATAEGFSTHSAADVVDNFETQSQADPTGFHVNVMEVGGTAQTANDNGADINEILTDTGTTLDGKLDDILEDTGATLPTAAEVATAVWTAASTRTDDFGTLLEQLAEFHLNDLTIANGTGIATLRNKANSGDLATWQITDDDTTTTRTDVVWS